MKYNTLISILCIVGAVVCDCSTNIEQPLVEAPIGKIRGSIIVSRHGRKIYSFRGIRYGEPPVGKQRFQPPIPAADWRNVFDATEEGPSCPHPDGVFQAEDCLRLNVYTTKLPCEEQNVKRPVMIFIHPGGFTSFSGQSLIFGPQYLLDKDIVLVTINYRLGTLGFLNTGDSEAPGNMGLKDQVEAFRWVRRNIAAFGGDPNSVTLCGYSAGSFSIMLHMVSPMSKDLFHRAISMSSSAIKPEVYTGIAEHGQKELVQKQAQLLNCPTDSTASMLNCLIEKPVENFTNTLANLTDWYGNPILLWTPAVEPQVPDVERFLSEQPYDSIALGKFHQVPYILGVTEHEFAGVAALYERNDKVDNGSLYREVNNNWNKVAPIFCMYERDTSRSNYISRQLRQFYFKDEPISERTLLQLGKVYGDCITIFPVYRAVKLFASKSREPVYFYKFTYEGRFGFYRWSNDTAYNPSHHDDLQYLFHAKQFPFLPYLEDDAPEAPMVELYTSMWSNFVINGEPIPRNDDRFENVSWETFDPSRTNYLEINLRLGMKTEFFPERMRLWETLFPLPSQPSRGVKH